MSTTVFRGARLVDPNAGLDAVADLLVDGEHIAAIGDGLSGDAEIDARGCVVIPGPVDLAARLREPGATRKATIASELRAAAASGITAVCIPPDTSPVVDDPAVVEWIALCAAAAGGARALPLAAATVGLAGDALTALGPLLRAGCVGVMHTGREPISPRMARRLLQHVGDFGLRLHVQCRDPSLADGSCAHDGVPAMRLGLPGSPACAETVPLAMWLELVADTGVGLHVGRLSSARGCELLRQARAEGLPVTADVAAHQLVLSDESLEGYDPMLHVDPPLRAESDRLALREAVHDGTIDAICSDHQPHDADAKTDPFPLTSPGISGLDTLVPLAFELVAEGCLSLPDMVRRLSTGPARILGVDNIGLAAGARADFVVVSTDCPWTLDRDRMASAGRNTPFHGRRFPARVRCTVVGGRLHHGPER